jgi:hypothetical protein
MSARPARLMQVAARGLDGRLLFAALVLAAALLPRTAAQPEAPALRPPGALAELTLDEGRRWPTDAALRAGMQRLLLAIDEALNAAGEPDYGALAQVLQREVRAVAVTTAVPPAARERLDIVLNELMLAADEMEHEEVLDRDAGLMRAVEAMSAYGEYFRDPGW